MKAPEFGSAEKKDTFAEPLGLKEGLTQQEQLAKYMIAHLAVTIGIGAGQMKQDNMVVTFRAFCLRLLIVINFVFWFASNKLRHSLWIASLQRTVFRALRRFISATYRTLQSCSFRFTKLSQELA